MEQPNNIDEILRQRLQNASVPPPDFVWTNVEQALRQRRRRFFFWLFAVGVASVSIWSLWQRPGLEQVPAASQSGVETTPLASAAQTPASVQVPETAPVAQADISAIPNTPKDIAAKKPSSTGHSMVSKSGANSNLSRVERLPQSAPAQTLPQQDLEVSEEVETGQVAPTQNQSKYSTDNLARSTAGFDLSGADLLPGRMASMSIPDRKAEVAPIELPILKKKKPKKCYDFHSNRQAWLIDAYVGPSLVQKRLDSPDPEFRDYLQDRLGTETQGLGFNAGLRASYLFAENFIIRTGLHYDRFVEEFEYIDPNFIKYTVIITQQLVNGQWESVPDTVDIQYGSNYQKSYNRFSLLDIPLQAALELRSGPTGISLNLGGSVNILFQKRGNMLSLDGKPVSFTPGDKQYDVFKPRVGMSLLGSIQWFYHITPRTRVFAEPYYRHILEPVSQPSYPLEQSYGVGGIRFGVTQIFD